MRNDTRTPDDIERDIVDERAQMNDTINDLQKKFSVDAIVSDLADMVRGRGADLGRSISETVGRNPAAVVVVGVGLAWLFLGNDRRPAGTATARQADRASFRRLPDPASDPWDTRMVPKDRSNDGSFRDDNHAWFGNGQMSGDTGMQERGPKDRAHKPPSLDASTNGITGPIRGAAAAVGDAVADAAGGVSDAASNLTARLSDGLEDLTEEARSRVLAARRAALEARVASATVMKEGARVASNFFEDQPLVVGALAVALGAAVGGMLPQSRIEDRAMGNSSDRLFAEAQALFREERDRVMAAAKMAAADAKEKIRDVGYDIADLLPEGKWVGEVIVDRASEAATRIVESATSDHEQQKRDRPPT